MKIFLSLITSLFLFSSFIYAEEKQSLQVQSVKLYDTSWTNPSDGTTPTLTAWKLMIILDDTHVLETNHQNFKETIDPRIFFKANDAIQVLQESYVDINPGHSWFKILNVTTGREFELTGLARKEKPIIESNSPSVQGLQKKQLSEKKWQLTFFITNLKSWLKSEMTEIYTTVEVDSEHFHHYYEGMPLTFIEEQIDEVDSLGKIRKSLVFFNSELNKEITFKSRWMGGPSILDVEKAQVNLRTERRYSAIHVKGWGCQIYLNDGTVFYVEENFSKNIVDYLFYFNDFLEGDKVELIETSTPAHVHTQYQTSYAIKNLRTGKIFNSTGEIRYLNGYVPSAL